MQGMQLQIVHWTTSDRRLLVSTTSRAIDFQHDNRFWIRRRKHRALCPLNFRFGATLYTNNMSFVHFGLWHLAASTLINRPYLQAAWGRRF